MSAYSCTTPRCRTRFQPIRTFVRQPRAVLCLPVYRKKRITGPHLSRKRSRPGRVRRRARDGARSPHRPGCHFARERRALRRSQERENAQRQRAESSLRESREQLQAVLENMVHAVIVCDKDGRITLLNQAAERLLGVSSASMPRIGDLPTIFRTRHPDGRPVASFEQPSSGLLPVRSSPRSR